MKKIFIIVCVIMSSVCAMDRLLIDYEHTEGIIAQYDDKTTIAEIKSQIERKIGIPVAAQTLTLMWRANIITLKDTRVNNQKLNDTDIVSNVMQRYYPISWGLTFKLSRVD